MTTSIVFQICNTIVLPAWLILIFLPGKQWRNVAIYSLCFLMALTYGFYILSDIGSLDFNSFGSLQGVKALFTNDKAVLAGWVHYLTFDLLVGNWILNQSRKLGIKHGLIVPALLLCFMFGPLGYLFFTVIKFANNGRIA